MGKTAVGVVVDTVTEVSTIAGADIEKQIQVTKKLENYVVGVGKQGETLVVILDLAKIIADSKDDLPNQEAKTSAKKAAQFEKIPVA